MKVIHRSQIPSSLPVNLTLIVWLIMDRFHASQLAYGIVGTLLAILWIGSIVAVVKEKHIKIRLE